MTLVIATGGIDLSVGSVVRDQRRHRLPAHQRASPTRTASAACWSRCALAPSWLALLLGAWNGFLVAGIGIQPIIATLILMVAGRGLAQLITEGQIITINSSPYKLIGAGLLAHPAVRDLHRARRSSLVAAVLTRRTALGMIDRVGRWQRRGEPAGRHPVPPVHPAGLRVHRRCAPASPASCDHGERLQRRRQQRRRCDRARRDPRGGHRRHVAGRRPVLPRRHGPRRAAHPDARPPPSTP